MFIILKLDKIMLISIVLIAIFAIGAVSAADENTTDTANEILSAEPSDEVISAEPAEELEVTDCDDFSGLVGLIKNTSSGQTLKLEKNYVNDGTYTKGILISKKMTIDGQGYTLDANNKSNIFRVSNDKVILKNINFINSYTKDYSAVYGKCTIINCTFEDCTAEKDGGAIYNGTAYDCSFTNCKAYIFDAGNIQWYYACRGGAIYNGDAYNCSFVSCKSYYEGDGSDWGETYFNGRGGAIYDGSAYNCSFVDCASAYGGAIYNGNAYNSSFKKCSAFLFEYNDDSEYKGCGGAIYNGYAYDCSFVKCTSVGGGAIYNGGAYNSSFDGCSAYSICGYDSGGAIAYGDAHNCSFTNCHAFMYGGAIARGNAYNCSFENCYSEVGGAIIYGNAYDSYFIKCSAYDGSAIYIGNATTCSFEMCSNKDNSYGQGGVIYRGNALDSTFINCTSSKTLIVNGKYINCTFIPLTLSSSNLTVNYGEGKKLPIKTIYGSEKIDGLTVNIKIYKDNKLINSFTTASGSDLPIDAAPGNYIMALTCVGAEPLNVSVIVNKGSPKLALANNFAKSSENANIKVSISKKATGFVKITINGVTYREQIKSGVVSVDVPGLADGAYTVTATYNGNAYHTAETITDTFHVGKFNQGIELACKNIKVGETERFTANLAKDATGFVRFIIGDDTYKVAIENGVAYIDIKDLKAGTYSVTLKYGGNYKYNAETVSKTFTVTKSSPGITITANSIYVGGVATIKVNMAKDVPGNVWITVNGESHKVAISNGVATLKLSGLKAGSYDVSVKYAGNYKYDAETRTAQFNVSKVTPTMSVSAKTSGGKTIITAKIDKDAPGNLKITYEGTTYTAKINNGVATLTVDGIISGSHSVKMKYAGNYKYEAATRTRTVTI